MCAGWGGVCGDDAAAAAARAMLCTRGCEQTITCNLENKITCSLKNQITCSLENKITCNLERIR